MKTFFLGRRWINNQRKSNSARCNTLHIKIIELICCARRLLKVTKGHLNDLICQHCGLKTNTVTPSFYYGFNIYLPCNNSIRSFIGNLRRVLLLGSHLKYDQTRSNSNKQGVQTVKCLFTKQCLMVFGRQTFIVCPVPKQTQIKQSSQLIQTAEKAWYACSCQTCLIRGCPNEQNIAIQTR